MNVAGKLETEAADKSNVVEAVPFFGISDRLQRAQIDNAD